MEFMTSLIALEAIKLASFQKSWTNRVSNKLVSRFTTRECVYIFALLPHVNKDIAI